jgi:hypothetical protein
VEKVKLYALASDNIVRQRINEAADDIDRLSGDAAGLRSQLKQLVGLDREQGRHIAKLERVVYVLMEMLVESGTVDVEKMNERIGRAVAAAMAVGDKGP